MLLGSGLDAWSALVLLRQIHSNSRPYTRPNSRPNAPRTSGLFAGLRDLQGKQL